MRKLRVLVSVFFAVSAIFFSTQSKASNDGSFYIGGTLGQIKSSSYCSSVNAPFKCDGTSQLLGGFVGIQTNRYFGVELGYVDFGKFDIQGSGTAYGLSCSPCIGNYSYSNTVKLKGIRFASIGSVPVGKGFFLLGKLGFLHWTASDESVLTSSGFPPGTTNLYPVTSYPGGQNFSSYSKTDSGNAPLVGLGMKYEIGERFAVRLDFEKAVKAYHRYDYDIFNTSLIYKF